MNVYRKHIDRITITGLYEDSEKAFRYCARNGYHIIRSGPKQISHMQYDASRFKIIAERERRPEAKKTPELTPEQKVKRGVKPDKPHSDAK